MLSREIYCILAIFLICSINYKFSLAITDEGVDVHSSKQKNCETGSCPKKSIHLHLTISKQDVCEKELCPEEVVDQPSSTEEVCETELCPKKDKNVETPEPTVCNTTLCKDTADTVLAFIDQTIDPCDNFYHFACGNFLKDEELVSPFTQNYVLVLYLMTFVIESLNNEAPIPFRMVNNYYYACMNEEQINQNSDREFVELLNKVGGWPVLVGKSWNESHFDWKESAYHFRNMGFSISNFIDFDVQIDAKNNSIRRIYVDQPDFDVHHEYLVQGLKNDFVKAYLQALVDIVVSFGAIREKAEQELRQSVNFEVELARITVPHSARRNASQFHNLMTIQELKTKYPFIPWLVYTKSILSLDTQVSLNESIVIAVPTYLEKLSHLLAKTPKRVQANYVFSRIVVQTTIALSNKVRTIFNRYYRAMYNSTADVSRWLVCLNDMTKQMNFAMNSLYIRNVFNATAKDRVTEMIQNIHGVFNDMLVKVDWMDAKMKKSVLEKLRNIEYLVAFTDDFYNDDKLVEYYKNLKVYSDNFLKSKLKLNSFQREKKFQSLRQPVKKSEWPDHISVSQINAFSRLSNSIVLPAGILQGSFYTNDKPEYMNYGAAGTIIGHELLHVVDDLGGQYDVNGNLGNWWHSNINDMFRKKSECIVNQYSNYAMEAFSLNINGSNVLGENIADIGGLKLAYLAYLSWQKTHPEDPRLPGLESYTPRQMFWIANANIWCQHVSPEDVKRHILTEVHPPREFRVILSMSNTPEFAKDFNCPVGSRMNPEKKCNFW